MYRIVRWVSCAVLGCTACGESPVLAPEELPVDARVEEILRIEGNIQAGEGLYLIECEVCHLEDGTGRRAGGTGKDLTDWLPRHEDRAAADAILYGRPGMLAYGTTFTDQQIADLLAYMRVMFAR